MTRTLDGFSRPAGRRFPRRPALLALLFAGLPQLAAAWIPIVELKFESGTATSSANTGSAGGSATLSATTPSYSSNTPINSGAYALDFGSNEGNYYADLTASNVLNGVKNLKSFTVTGFVNCRSSLSNYGGGRIVSWMNGTAGAGGVDLAMRSDGSLGLGVDTWNDQGGVTSSPSKISADAGVSYDNWVFFAVSYDGTATANNVKFYFGTNNDPAALDRTMSLNQGPTAGTIANSVTVGNVPSNLRAAPFTSVFRGLIDQVRIYGSTSNSSGVLTLDQIQSLQQALPLANRPGVIYEQWNGIAGSGISALLSDSRYPSSPSVTKLQSAFEGFTNIGDNFGARLSGWVKAPETGSYTFWLVSDDNGELRLSTDANPANKRLIASVGTFNSAQDQWTQFPSQQSEPVTLQANQYYYIEALVKEGSGGDFVRVGWQLPSGTLERPIPQARVMTTPPDAVPFYPSAYPLYEPGTYVRKATMGWEKKTGDDHFYIKTDETKALIAKNGTAIFPERLFFGGQYLDDPNQNDLGFRWYRPTVGDFGNLSLETQGGRWAFQVESGSEMEPHVTFNERLDINGPEVEANGKMWYPFASLHHFEGAGFTRSRVADGSGVEEFETGVFNANTLSLSSDFMLGTVSSLLESRVRPGTAQFQYKNRATGEVNRTDVGMGYLSCIRMSAPDVVQYRTDIGSFGITTNDVNSTTVHATTVVADTVMVNDLVVTPKWRVAVPDYVFEKGYRVRSLEEIEGFVQKNKHLPGIPSAKELEKKGMNVAEMNLHLLKSVEELTLHVIALNKELKEQRNRNDSIQSVIRSQAGSSKGRTK